MTSKVYLANGRILLKFWIGIFSDTFGKKFMQIDHHSIEL